MSNDKPHYQVGYGRPPQNGKFSKGKSGNPKGRPKTSSKAPPAAKGLMGLVGQEAERLIALTENGRTQQISFSHGLVKAMFSNASRSRLERKDLLKMLLEIEKAELDATQESYYYWQGKKRDGLALIKKHQSLGLPPPQLSPHPADIVLNATDLSVRVIGPLDEDDLLLYEAIRTLRECLFAMSELNMRSPKPLTLETENKAACVFGVLAAILNAEMPPSQAQAASERLHSAWRYCSLPTKQLRREQERFCDLLSAQMGDLRRVGRLGDAN